MLYTGTDIAAPASLTVNQVNSASPSLVNIQELYDKPVPASNANGPAVFLTASATNTTGGVALYSGTVDNVSGQVAITVADGSIVSSATINAEQVNLNAKNGVVAVSTPNATDHIAGDPAVYLNYQSVMLWPGGNPSGPTNAALALASVVNAVYNPTDSSNDVAFNQLFIGNAGTTSTSAQFSVVFYGGDVPYDGDGTGGNSFKTAQAYDTNVVGVSGLSPIAIAPPNNLGNQNDGWFPAVPVEPTQEGLSTFPPPASGSPTSAINAAGVFINAQYIDVNGVINVGQANTSSVSLPSSLNAVVSSDQSNYKAGKLSTTAGDAAGFYTLPATTVNTGDTQITAQYDAITQQIIVNNVSAATAGSISLDGGIMSTDTLGELNVADGNGQVTINNQTSTPVVVNNVSAAGSQNPTAQVDIIDTNAPAGTQQRLYIHESGVAGVGIYEYVGQASLSPQQLVQSSESPSGFFGGTSTSFQPQAGQRWQWQYQANLFRSVTIQFGTSFGVKTVSATPWVFDTPTVAGSLGPWEYVNAAGTPSPYRAAN